MALEIERKWLVKDLPDLVYTKHSYIEQAYVLDIDKTVLRVRSYHDGPAGEKFGHITAKGPSTVAGAVEEYQMRIPYEMARALISACPKTIIKTRYYIATSHHMIELDVFHGKYQGLVIAEVEDDGEDLFRNFSIPEWFGEEVTGKQEYSNAYMVKML